jgi:hypothetical protein
MILPAFPRADWGGKHLITRFEAKASLRLDPIFRFGGKLWWGNALKLREHVSRCRTVPEITASGTAMFSVTNADNYRYTLIDRRASLCAY